MKIGGTNIVGAAIIILLTTTCNDYPESIQQDEEYVISFNTQYIIEMI